MSETVAVGIHRLPHARDLPVPSAVSEGSAGLDLRAAVGDPIELAPGSRVLVPTGLILELPAGWEAQVRPRSGLALRHGVTVLNSPGTIDSDYRGEVGVILVNHGEKPFSIERGSRIAQIVLARTRSVAWTEIDEVSPSGRGTGGFGSSGRD